VPVFSLGHPVSIEELPVTLAVVEDYPLVIPGG
jgi:hypothetical protein